ncbi:MAG: glycerol-3-phosphate dehydrogenase subunit GlpB [Desulfobacteraceae bacterium]
MSDLKEIKTDLMVIGSGMAGMAAAMFAAGHGIDTVQVGISGEINFASGLLDVLGVHPVAKGTRWADPWEAIERLVHDEPLHPYAKLGIDRIQSAMDLCLDFLKQAGLSYQTSGRRNSKIVTPAGTVKTTYGVPRSMFAGIQALDNRTPTLLVGLSGLKGFSTRLIMETMGPSWPALERITVDLPNSTGELYAEHVARSMDLAANRRVLADLIKPGIGECRAVGLPAVLGIYRTNAALDDLETALGIPVFEIPTMVPAVTGLRLREAFEHRLAQLGVRAHYQQKVLETEALPDGRFQFLVGHQVPEARVLAKRAILATGRFFGKGLHADRLGIRESLFNLPVDQPDERSRWHHRDLLYPGGHPINRAGVMVDAQFRPINSNGDVIHSNLFAVGSILAHQDWIRQKCGSGLSIATAYGAVRTVAS